MALTVHLELRWAFSEACCSAVQTLSPRTPGVSSSFCLLAPPPMGLASASDPTLWTCPHHPLNSTSWTLMTKRLPQLQTLHLYPKKSMEQKMSVPTPRSTYPGPGISHRPETNHLTKSKLVTATKGRILRLIGANHSLPFELCVGSVPPPNHMGRSMFKV